MRHRGVFVLTVWVWSLSLLVDALAVASTRYRGLTKSRSCQISFASGMPVMDMAGHNKRRRRCQLGAGTSLSMDLEEGFHERKLLGRVLGGVGASAAFDELSFRCDSQPCGVGAAAAFDELSFRCDSQTLSSAEKRHGMPWRQSIASYTPPAPSDQLKAGASPLLFMPFWTRQLDFLKNNLTNLRPIPVDEDISYRENNDGNARIVNHCYASDEYRLIRMTYYDAGDKCQVFNSLWYPHPRYSVPVLGIDLLAFKRRAEDSNNDIRGKYLSVIDFQPIHDDETDDSMRFSEALGSIRSDYGSLQGTMTSRFYDHSRHFSSNMLYGRCEYEAFVPEELAPAFERSIDAHLNLLKNTQPDVTESGFRKVLEGQAAYDSYSSIRDPAKALFSKMFGEEWADKYVFDFLFSLSDEESIKKEQMIMKSERRRQKISKGASHT